MRAPWPIRAGIAVALRPHLWVTATRQVWRLRRRRWYRAWPFLPVPDPGYLHFRLVTAYGGDGSATPRPDDVVAYLEWCRAWPYVTH